MREEREEDIGHGDPAQDDWSRSFIRREEPERGQRQEISMTAGITKCGDSWGISPDNCKSRKEIS